MKAIIRNIVVMSLIIVYLFTLKANAQTYVIPDSNFRQFLKDSFPSVLDSQDHLIISAAATVTKDINAMKKNISSIDGIQYFTSTRTLNLDYNNITTLPDLSPLTAKLMQLSLSGNQIDSLPSLQIFTHLRVLRVDSCNLTSIPSLSGLTQLYRVFCRLNKLTRLPDLQGCTTLYHLLCSDNQIDSLPDFSTNPALNNFSCFNNKIKYVHDYSNLTNLTIFKIYNNQLTFDDLLLLSKHPNFDNVFFCFPQDSITVQDQWMVNENDTLNLYLGFDDTVTTNSYNWYKDGKLMATTPTNRYKIYPVKSSDAGQYYCRVQNYSRPQWINSPLYTTTFSVKVVPCLITNNLTFTEVDSDCKLGLTVNVDESAIVKGTPPFNYKLYNTLTNDTLFYSGKTLNSILPGVYDLFITDKNQCSNRVPEFIHFQEQAKCDVVMTPDGDGKNDQYFINENGKVKIYNVSGVLVKTTTAPVSWDGRNDKGELVPMGLYAIIIEDHDVINITVIY